jgi:cell division protein FtsW (lipid II flippase)
LSKCNREEGHTVAINIRQPDFLMRHKGRLADGLLALLLTALGWAWLLGQNDRIFERQPDHTVERFVADTVPVPMPEQLAMAALEPLCKNGVPFLASYWPGAFSSHLADCVTTPGLLNEAGASELLRQWSADLQGRIDLAHRWADAYDKTYAERRAALERQLHRIQGRAEGQPAADPQSADPFSGDGILRPPVQGQAGRALREHAQATQTWLNELLADTQTPVAERAARVGLLIAGKKVQTDYGVYPPRHYLNSDSNSLAERMEWRRRPQALVQEGLSQPRVHALAPGVLLASVVLLTVVAWLGMAITPWALISLLLGLGCLLVVDLGLAGDAAFRALAFRQWGGWAVPGIGWSLWWPLLAVAMLLVLLRLPGLARSRFAGALGRLTDRIWIQPGHSTWPGVVQAFILAALAVVVVGVPGFAAAKSEVLIALGCIGLATFLARETALANVGASAWAGGQWIHWARQEWAYHRQRVRKDVIRQERLQVLQQLVLVGVVLASLLGVVVASVVRGDLGHVLVALGMAGVFFGLFGGPWMRGLLLLAFVAGLVLLGVMYVQQTVPEWLQGLIRSLLPYHAQERFLGMVDPLSVTASDMARVRWLMASADLTGWGAGWVPWSGLGEVRLSDGVPLQGPSDYVPALLVAQWGVLPGTLMLLAVLVLFVSAAVVAGRTALAQGVSQPVRLLAGVGLFGCVLMAFKVVLSLGGVTGVLPLTGLPVALVGYGTVSTFFGLAYLALALGTRHHRVGGGVQLHAGPVLKGPLVRRGRALVGLAGVAAVVLTLASVARMNQPLAGAAGQTSCDIPQRHQRDILGEPLEALAPARRSDAPPQPHCSASAYQLTQALVHAMKPQAGDTAPATVQPPPDPVASADATAIATPALASDSNPSDEAETDPDSALVSPELNTQRAVAAVNALDPGAALASAAALDVCQPMAHVVAAWNRRLTQLQGAGAAHLQAISLDALRTHMTTAGIGWQNRSECTHRARELGLLLQSSLPDTLAAGGQPTQSAARRFAAFFEPSAAKAVQKADHQTPNAWRGLPGCVVPVGALASGRNERRCTAEDRAARFVPPPAAAATTVGTAAAPASEPAAAAVPQPVERLALNNHWLQQDLAGRLGAARSYSDDNLRFEWRRHTVQAGPVTGLTIDPVLQDLAQRVAECYTGQRTGRLACAGVMPPSDKLQQAYFGVNASPGANLPKRAGALGLVLAEVETGRVVALANAVSDCSLKAMATAQSADPNNPKKLRPVIGNIDPTAKDAPHCLPWPDRTHAYLGLQAPALWQVPPGSSLKPLVVMAGVQGGFIPPSDRDRWRAILARSQDLTGKTQNSVKQVAVSAAAAYRDTLRQAGFDLEPSPGARNGFRPRELLWGDPAGLGDDGQPLYNTRWTLLTELIGHRVSVNDALVPWRLPQNLPWEKFLAMWTDKQRNMDYAAQVQKHGREALAEYPYAQALANASIGGGDIRISAVGLADVWRSMDLLARGRQQKAALHLLEAPGTPVPQLPLKLASPAAAEFALHATSAVTRPGGTAHGACTRVGLNCSGTGVQTLHGKTGTSDFTQTDTTVKPGLHIPAKLFGGVFEVQGRRYAVAAVGLRVRTGRTLDGNSAPAEAALTLVRELQRLGSDAAQQTARATAQATTPSR